MRGGEREEGGARGRASVYKDEKECMRKEGCGGRGVWSGGGEWSHLRREKTKCPARNGREVMRPFLSLAKC